MELSAKGLSVSRGKFLDPARFRRTIGDQVFQSLRYYEAAVEVVPGDPAKRADGDEDKHSKSLHRVVLLTEAVLFVFDVSRKEAAKDVWEGECAHAPILLKNVLEVRTLAKRSEIFAEDEINKTVRHFELTFLAGGGERKTVELAAWERHSLLFCQITSAWTNLLVRLCLRIEISISLDDQDESKTLIGELYHEISSGILGHRRDKPLTVEQVIAGLNELASAALHDRELKRQFFSNPALLQHLLHELESSVLPQNRPADESSASGGDPYAAARGNADDTPPPAAGALRFSGRTQQLEYVRAIYFLLHCMTFNSQTVLERSSLLTPEPYSFPELLATICTQFDSRAVHRELHRRAGARARAAAAQDKGDSTVNSSDESDSELDDSDDEEGDFAGPQQQQGSGSDVQESRRDAAVLRSISEHQVAILVELDDFISLAVSQGRSRAVVSETLARQLAKAGSEFPRSMLGRFVKNLVGLIDSWGKQVEGSSDAKFSIEALGGASSKRKSQNRIPERRGKDASAALSVRIFQHCKLLHLLVLGNYVMIEHLLDYCEEELFYYIFKDKFLGKLSSTPDHARCFVQINVLNRLSREMILEVKEAIEDLQMRKEQQLKDNSVLLP